MIHECAVKQQETWSERKNMDRYKGSHRETAVRAGQISPSICICHLSFLCVVLSHVGG